MKIRFRCTRGELKGRLFEPKRDADGFYIVAKDKFKESKIRVSTLTEVANYYRKGYTVRMGDPVKKHPPVLPAHHSLYMAE